MFDMRYSCTFQNYYMKLMFLNHDILPELIMFIISFQEHFIERRRCYMPITDRDTGLYTVLVQMWSIWNTWQRLYNCYFYDFVTFHRFLWLPYMIYMSNIWDDLSYNSDEVMLIIMTDAVPAVFIVCASLVCVFIVIVIELLLFHTHAHSQRTLGYIIIRMCVVFIGLFILYIMIVFVFVEQKYNILTTSIVYCFHWDTIIAHTCTSPKLSI